LRLGHPSVPRLTSLARRRHGRVGRSARLLYRHIGAADLRRADERTSVHSCPWKGRVGFPGGRPEGLLTSGGCSHSSANCEQTRSQAQLLSLLCCYLRLHFSSRQGKVRERGPLGKTPVARPHGTAPPRPRPAFLRRAGCAGSRFVSRAGETNRISRCPCPSPPCAVHNPFVSRLW